MLKFPVGVAADDVKPGATVIVIVSLTPEAGSVDAGDSVVCDGSNEDAEDVGHAFRSLAKSIDPNPEASS
jgi:hypothetical protein